MIKMPTELSKKDNGRNNEVFIFDKPIIVRPSSSGKGEATTKAPKNGITHLKNLKRKTVINLFNPDFLIKIVKSSASLSLINLKIIKSPIKAPNPPIIATRKTELV